MFPTLGMGCSVPSTLPLDAELPGHVVCHGWVCCRKPLPLSDALLGSGGAPGPSFSLETMGPAQQPLDWFAARTRGWVDSGSSAAGAETLCQPLVCGSHQQLPQRPSCSTHHCPPAGQTPGLSAAWCNHKSPMDMIWSLMADHPPAEVPGADRWGQGWEVPGLAVSHSCGGS